MGSTAEEPPQASTGEVTQPLPSCKPPAVGRIPTAPPPLGRESPGKGTQRIHRTERSNSPRAAQIKHSTIRQKLPIFIHSYHNEAIIPDSQLHFTLSTQELLSIAQDRYNQATGAEPAEQPRAPPVQTEAQGCPTSSTCPGRTSPSQVPCACSGMLDVTPHVAAQQAQQVLSSATNKSHAWNCNSSRTTISQRASFIE